MRSLLLVIVLVVVCQGDLSAQAPALDRGSVGAARASAGVQRYSPTVNGKKIGLSEIEDGYLKPGAEGIPYFGESVISDDPTINTSTFKVLQVIDDGNLIISSLGKVWWIEMPTDGVADDTKIDLSRKVFTFIGTKRYESNFGAKTVFHLKYLRDAAREPKPDLTRDWKDASGKFTVRAEFGGLARGRVKLLKPDGTGLTVDLAKLSKADRDWIRSKNR